MAITFVAAGAVATGTQWVTPALPAGWVPDDLAVLVVATAETDGTVPTLTPTGGDWAYAGTEISTTGTYGVGAGPRRLTYYTRVLATGDAAPYVALPAATDVAIAGQVIGLRKGATEAWSVMTPEFADEPTSGTSFSQALAAIPSRMVAGATVVLGYALPVTTAQALSAEGITGTGATFGAVTERGDAGATGGNGVWLGVATTTVTTGPPSAAPVVTATLGAASPGIAGALVVLATVGTLTAQQAIAGDRLRYNEIPNPSAEANVTTGVKTYASTGTVNVSVVDVVTEGVGFAPSSITGRRAFRAVGASTNTTNLGLGFGLALPKPTGTVVTMSFDLFLPPGHAVDTVRVGWAPAAGATYANTIASSSPVTGWARYSATHTVPAGQTLGDVYAYTVDAAGARGGDTIYLDHLMFEVAGSAGAYFDGDTSADGYAALWTGAPQLSESALYYAQDPPRVGVTLTNWGTDTDTTVYRVREADGVRTPVRGGVLTPSGGAAFVWDYEFPTNESIYYVADDNGTERSSAKQAEIILRRNGMRNPALTIDATDWSTAVASSGTATGARITTGGPTVNGIVRNFYRMTWATVSTGALANTGIFCGSSTATYVEASPGPWVGSVYWRSSVTARTAQIVAAFYDSTNALLGSITGTADQSSGSWIRSSVVGTAPAGTVRATVRLNAVGGPVWVVGDTLEASAWLIEDGQSDVDTYFDGDTPGTGFRWTGSAGASWSEQFASDVPTPLVVSDSRSFLRAPGLPGLDTVVRVGSVPRPARPRNVNYLAPIGRRTLVPQAGARTAPQYSLELVTLTDAETDALIGLLEGAATAYLLFPNTRFHGTYVSLADAQENPNATIGPQEEKWTVAAVEVSRPAGGIAYDPTASWQSVVDTSSSWQAVLNTYPSWLDVLRGPGTYTTTVTSLRGGLIPASTRPTVTITPAPLVIDGGSP